MNETIEIELKKQLKRIVTAEIKREINNKYPPYQKEVSMVDILFYINKEKEASTKTINKIKIELANILLENEKLLETLKQKELIIVKNKEESEEQKIETNTLITKLEQFEKDLEKEKSINEQHCFKESELITHIEELRCKIDEMTKKDEKELNLLNEENKRIKKEYELLQEEIKEFENELKEEVAEAQIKQNKSYLLFYEIKNINDFETKECNCFDFIETEMVNIINETEILKQMYKNIEEEYFKEIFNNNYNENVMEIFEIVHKKLKNIEKAILRREEFMEQKIKQKQNNFEKQINEHITMIAELEETIEKEKREKQKQKIELEMKYEENEKQFEQSNSEIVDNILAEIEILKAENIRLCKELETRETKYINLEKTMSRLISPLALKKEVLTLNDIEVQTEAISDEKMRNNGEEIMTINHQEENKTEKPHFIKWSEHDRTLSVTRSWEEKENIGEPYQKIAELNALINYMMDELKGFTQRGLRRNSWAAVQAERKKEFLEKSQESEEMRKITKQKVAFMCQKVSKCRQLVKDFHIVTDYYWTL